MENGLKYSNDALLNRVMFLSHNNEVIIFVEDQDKQYIYEGIFERMFQNEITINQIFPMNGKAGVEKAHLIYGKAYEGKPTIYLVDGDFDLLLEKNMVCDENYVYLEKYNIESYYVEKSAVLKYMVGKMKKTKKEVAEIIAFDDWKKRTLDGFFELFINFVISQRAFPSEKTLGSSIFQYLQDNGDIDATKVAVYAKSLRARIDNYDMLISQYNLKFLELLGGDKSKLICGKCLIASLQLYLRKVTGKNFKKEDFTYDLSIFFDVHQLDYVKYRIEDILRKSCESKLGSI